ncbi:MAG: hypothetical protein D6816_13115 [Bacteroidetes bacterium]|nr:MAG: hypothetical protein D6816_13115 [Bacteroidota bacterium]
MLVGPEKELNEENAVDPTENEKKTETVLDVKAHGPFRIDKIKPEHYVPLSLTELADRIEAHFRDPFYLEQYGPVPEEAKREIHLFLDQFDPEEVKCYFLNLEFNPDDETYKRELEPEVVLLDDFAEYVLIEHDKNILHFIMICFD